MRQLHQQGFSGNNGHILDARFYRVFARCFAPVHAAMAVLTKDELADSAESPVADRSPNRRDCTLARVARHARLVRSIVDGAG